MHARNSSEFLLALDSIQARSQVFFYGEVRSKKETHQIRPDWLVPSRVKLWLYETELRGKFTIGGRGAWIPMR